MIDLHPIVEGCSADVCRTVCLGSPTPEQQAACDLYLKAQQAAVAKAKAGVTMNDLEETLHGVLRGGGRKC